MFRRLPLALVAFGIAMSTCASMTSAQSMGLREAADAADLNFGAAVTTDALVTDEAYRDLLVDNVNMVSTVDEVAFAVVQPAPGVYDFTRADTLVDFADSNDMTARGHGLVTADGLPDWIVNGAWTAETLGKVLSDHVTSVVSRYAERNPGVVTQWDVVDEAFLPDGTLRDSIWRRVIGDDYLRIAFEAARAADPAAQLFYDDFYDDLSVTQDAVDNGVAIVPGATTQRSNCADVPKCVGVQTTVAALIGAGVPIDAIGLQSRIRSPDPVDVAQFSTWVEDLGLRWAITEVDVQLPVTEITNAESLAFQAEVYADTLSACVESTACDTFVTWGITDRLPPTPDSTGGAFGGALWFDATDAPKPAFDAMATVLEQSSTVVATTELAPTTPAQAPDATVAPGSGTGTSTGSGVTTGFVIGGIALCAVAAVVVVLRRRR
ncbi:MAG TPA: endo-1,4-beta-xylanase [Ilumatobacteraceae bacterium]|nr:endo-1,4-beta-xylanase [Ilumatobacteraceae bacterium]